MIKKMQLTNRLVVDGITKATIKKFNAISIATSICKESGIIGRFELKDIPDDDIKKISEQKKAVYYQASYVVPYNRCTINHNEQSITIKSEVITIKS